MRPLIYPISIHIIFFDHVYRRTSAMVPPDKLLPQKNKYIHTSPKIEIELKPATLHEP